MNFKVTVFGLVILAALLAPEHVSLIAHGQPASEPELRQLNAVLKVVLDKKKLAEFGLKPAHVNAALTNSCGYSPITIDHEPIKLVDDVATFVEIKLLEKEVTKARDEAKRILALLQSIVITSINEKPIKLGDVATIDMDFKLTEQEVPKAEDKAKKITQLPKDEKLNRDANANGQPVTLQSGQSDAAVTVIFDKKKLNEIGVQLNDACSAIEYIYKPGVRFKLAELQKTVIGVVNGKKYLLKDVATIDVDFENKAGPISEVSPKLIRDMKGRPGLQLSKEDVKGLGIKVAAAQAVTKPQPLPPQIGTVNFDSERLFVIRSRFSREIVKFGQVEETPDLVKPNAKPVTRPWRLGDCVKQGAVLAVIYSRELGKAKAAFVDAVLNLKPSQEQLARLQKLYEDGAIPLVPLAQAERQVQWDTTAVFTAERALYLMKLNKNEVQDLRDEAKALGEAMKNKKFVRNPEAEATKWATVEIRAAQLSNDPNHELTVVEKNTSIGDIVEPGKDRPLMRLADMSKLQIVFELPQEYLALVRKMLESSKKAALNAQVYLQGDALEKPLPLQFTLVPSISGPLPIAREPHRACAFAWQ
jgi:hypothetical protein